MGQGFLLLTASMLAGQQPGCNCAARAAEVAAPVAAEASPSFMHRVLAWRPFARDDSTGERPRLFGKLFNRTSDAGMTGTVYAGSANALPSQAYQTMPASKLVEPPLAEATQSKSNSFVAPSRHDAAAPVTVHVAAKMPSGQEPESLRTAVTVGAASTAMPLSPKVAEKVGHESDYTWITGQIHQESGRWLIRYAAPESVDRYGGQAVLVVPTSNMNSFRNGDLVSVHGQIIGSDAFNSALYHATSVTLVEHMAN